MSHKIPPLQPLIPTSRKSELEIRAKRKTRDHPFIEVFSQQRFVDKKGRLWIRTVIASTKNKKSMQTLRDVENDFQTSHLLFHFPQDLKGKTEFTDIMPISLKKHAYDPMFKNTTLLYRSPISSMEKKGTNLDRKNKNAIRNSEELIQKMYDDTEMTVTNMRYIDIQMDKAKNINIGGVQPKSVQIVRTRIAQNIKIYKANLNGLINKWGDFEGFRDHANKLIKVLDQSQKATFGSVLA